MFRPRWKGLLIGVVVVAALTTAANSADAGYWWGSYPYSSWGCCYSPCTYTPCYSVGYEPCSYGTYGWSAGVRPGPIRRLVLGPYRYYWGPVGGWYADCGWSGITYDCCGKGAMTTEPTGTQEPTPAEKPKMETQPQTPKEPVSQPIDQPAAPAGTPANAPGPMGAGVQGDSGLLTVYVPYEARVFVNGLETQSTGSKRQFVSYGLKPGHSYKYEIRAEVDRDREMIVDTKIVVLRAGDRGYATFPFPKKSVEGLALSP